MWQHMFRVSVMCSALRRERVKSIIQVVAACRIWCFGLQVVGMVRS